MASPASGEEHCGNAVERAVGLAEGKAASYRDRWRDDQDGKWEKCTFR
jgi:hypothetical protein